MRYLMLLSLLFAFNVKAEINSDDLQLPEETIQAPTMDLEGQYKVQEPAAPTHEAATVTEAPVVKEPKKIKKLSQSDRLREVRARLEERNRIMLERKIEQIRYQQELALARQLEQSMNQTLKAIDSIKN
ncbi:MAG: hypothetical protein WC635_13480 [Bacteriovorax sp.]|jgi:hypothetical protein